MSTSSPTPAELKRHLSARAIFLQTTRDDELRRTTSAEGIANILAVDGFVAMTAATQSERIDGGMQEQQRLFRLMRTVSHG
jgi:hypothetical protein